MSHFDELGKSFPKQFLNTSYPIHRPPDLLGEKIFNVLPSQRFDRPVIEDGNFQGLNLNLLKDRHNLFSQRVKRRRMKSRIEGKARGRDGFSGEGKGNRFFHTPLLSRKNE